MPSKPIRHPVLYTSATGISHGASCELAVQALYVLVARTARLGPVLIDDDYSDAWDAFKPVQTTGESGVPSWLEIDSEASLETGLDRTWHLGLRAIRVSGCPAPPFERSKTKYSHSATLLYLCTTSI